MKRLVVEGRAVELPTAGSACSFRVMVSPISIQVEAITCAGMIEDQERISVRVNPHRSNELSGFGEEVSDLAIEGDLASMEELARGISKAVRALKARLRHEARGTA